MFSEDHRNPTGDTIEFSERVPLVQVRKDALAIAVYTLTLEAAKPVCLCSAKEVDPHDHQPWA